MMGNTLSLELTCQREGREVCLRVNIGLKHVLKVWGFSSFSSLCQEQSYEFDEGSHWEPMEGMQEGAKIGKLGEVENQAAAFRMS